MSTRTEIYFLHSAHFACHFFLLIFPTAVIAIERETGYAYGDALALGTPMYLCFALATLPAGWFGDRWGGGRLIGIFFIGCGLAGMGLGLAARDSELMAGLGVLGVFAAIYHPVGLSRLTQLSPQRGRLLAINGVYGNLGLAFAAVCSGWITDLIDWRAAFAIPGCLSLGLGLLYFSLRGRDLSNNTARQAQCGSSEASNPRSGTARVIAVVLCAALFGGLVFNGVTLSLPKLFDERLQSLAPNLAAIGSYSAAVFALAAFAQLPVGWLLDKFGGRNVFIGIFALQVCALAAMASATGAWSLLSALVAITLLFGGIPISGWLLGYYVSVNWRSRAFAAEYLLSLGVGAAVVPMLASLYRAGFDFEFQYRLFALAALAVVLIAGALPRLNRRRLERGWTA